MTLAARVSEEHVHAPALELAAVLLEQAGPGNECRELIRVCLADKDPGHRLRAVQLAREPQLKLFKEAVSLLSDPAVEVRRAAILAVGSASQEEVVDDDLLRSLHDPDEDVRRTCEAVLRSEPRRFTEEQLKLSRLLTDDDPAVRLQVLEYLHRRSDLEPGVWLRRLSHDSERAVRAAALRTAAEQTLVDLSDRMAQMAQSDPSPTICELARYFLSYQKRRQSQPSRP